MRILVLGAGLQGRGAAYDLARSEAVTEVVAADRDVAAVQTLLQRVGLAGSVPCREVDAEDPEQLEALIGQGFDVIVDLLPVGLHDAVAEVALRHRVHLVTASYPSPAMRGMAARAESAGVALPPGFNLVFLGEAVRRFDTVDQIRSYAAGFPEPAAADNPLGYKVTWRLEGVLASYLRPGRVVRDGAVVQVAGKEVMSVTELPKVVREIGIKVAIVAVPSAKAQQVVDAVQPGPALAIGVHHVPGRPRDVRPDGHGVLLLRPR